jgi:hypothetical protein
LDLSGRYSWLDRMLHHVAFATNRAQFELTDLTDRLFRRELSGVTVRDPVFITSLPRAGTTVLLQVCSASDEFASHTYRDMPFVLLPLLWNRLSGGFRRSGTSMERAHGDGMLVSPDSAEAFEEMLWMARWPEHYRADRIIPWSGRLDPEFVRTFINHLKQIILLRQTDPTLPPRYASKGNGNIARLGVLHQCFPDALIVVPVREPLQQVASLRQQHVRFLDIHARDGFARRYMRGIGHFEFGANLRPVDFDGWLASARYGDARTIDFWLEYWVVAYEHFLSRYAGAVHFFPYDAFCASPALGLGRLASLIKASDSQALIAQQNDIHPPRRHEVPTAGLDRTLLSRAEAVYREVLERALAAA